MNNTPKLIDTEGKDDVTFLWTKVNSLLTVKVAQVNTTPTTPGPIDQPVQARASHIKGTTWARPRPPQRAPQDLGRPHLDRSSLGHIKHLISADLILADLVSTTSSTSSRPISFRPHQALRLDRPHLGWPLSQLPHQALRLGRPHLGQFHYDHFKLMVSTTLSHSAPSWAFASDPWSVNIAHWCPKKDLFVGVTDLVPSDTLSFARLHRGRTRLSDVVSSNTLSSVHKAKGNA